MWDQLLAQTPITASGDPNLGTLLVLFMGYSVTLTGGIITALLTGRVYTPNAVKLIEDAREEQKARIEKLEATLAEANDKNRDLSKSLAESQEKQAEAQEMLSKALDRLSHVLAKGGQT